MFDWGWTAQVDRFCPPLGWGATGVLLAVALASAVVRYARDGGAQPRRWQVALGLLRVGAVVLLAWVLAGPSVQRGGDSSQAPPPVVMLLDTSASMDQADGEPLKGVSDVDGGGPSDQPALVTRWGTVRRWWLDPGFLGRLRAKAPGLRLFGFDQRLQPLSIQQAATLEPRGDATDLYGAILGVIGSTGRSGDPSGRTLVQPVEPNEKTGVVVVLSDGHDTQRGVDAAALERLRQTAWPVWTVPVGSASRGRRDIAVSAWPDSEFLFEGQSTWVHVDLAQVGLDERVAVVDLMHAGRVVESREVAFKGRATARQRFKITPHVEPNREVTMSDYRVVARLRSGRSATPTEGSDTAGETAGHPEGPGALPGAIPGGDVGADDEPYTDNNSRWVFVRVSKARIRVVLFEGQPHWDTQFLARVLREDPQVALTTVFGLGPNRVVRQRGGTQHDSEPGMSGEKTDRTNPVQSDLDGFDVVILGKGAQRFFGGARASMLVDYVQKRGGALILARSQPFDASTPSGRQAQRLTDPLLPVRWGERTLHDMALRLTPAGRASPLTRFEHLGRTDTVLTRLPDMIAATQVRQEKAASIVWLRQSSPDQPPVGAEQDQPTAGPRQEGRSAPAGGNDGDDDRSRGGMAALVYQNVGQGRVVAVLNEGLWRWAFLPSRLSRFDSVYRVFWTRVVRWLAGGGAFLPGQSVSMELSRLAVEPNEPVEVTVIKRYAEPGEAVPRLTVQGPDGQIREPVLTRVGGPSPRYQAAITPPTAGVYELTLTVPPADAQGVSGVGEVGQGADPDRQGDPRTAPTVRLTRRLAVYDRAFERLETSARPDVLGAISRVTGGKTLAVDEPDRLLAWVAATGVARRSDGTLEPVFNRPMVFVAIVGLLGVEWFVRRRLGMP